ncbi:MAG: hypothetical protein ACPGGK_11165, partial [Pikeienuella sp.]
MSDNPIIYPHMDDRMGNNINGPSIIAMPEWAQALGQYHLYFSDHKGTYIRLAHADQLIGPWTIHRPGSLDLADSFFEPTDPPPPPPGQRPPWAEKMDGGYLYAHIASPDVHIDHANKRFVMFYHGLLYNGDQLTRMATSIDGVTFTANEQLLAPPYTRAFLHAGMIYAITWAGDIWRAPDWGSPFEQGPNLVFYDSKEGIGEGIRHAEARIIDDKLHLFYTRFSDRPERILHSTVNIRSDWMDWTASSPNTLLSPSTAWEGADLPLQRS